MYGIVAVVTGPALVSSVGISVTVSFPSNKVHVVIVLAKNVVRPELLSKNLFSRPNLL